MICLLKLPTIINDSQAIYKSKYKTKFSVYSVSMDIYISATCSWFNLVKKIQKISLVVDEK